MAAVTELQPNALPGKTHSFAAKPLAGSVYASYGKPFLYTQEDWRLGEFFLESYMWATTGTSFARLHDDTDTAAVSGSEISTTSNTLARVRSNTGLVLTNAHIYRVQLKASAASAGRAFGADLLWIGFGPMRMNPRGITEVGASLRRSDWGERRFTFFAAAEELTF